MDKNTLTREDNKELDKIRERNKKSWQIVDSRYSEIIFLLELVARLSRK